MSNCYLSQLCFQVGPLDLIQSWSQQDQKYMGFIYIPFVYLYCYTGQCYMIDTDTEIYAWFAFQHGSRGS
jgi:hypothetical protein